MLIWLGWWAAVAVDVGTRRSSAREARDDLDRAWQVTGSCSLVHSGVATDPLRRAPAASNFFNFPAKCTWNTLFGWLRSTNKIQHLFNFTFYTFTLNLRSIFSTNISAFFYISKFLTFFWKRDCQRDDELHRIRPVLQRSKVLQNWSPRVIKYQARTIICRRYLCA